MLAQIFIVSTVLNVLSIWFCLFKIRRLRQKTSQAPIANKLDSQDRIMSCPGCEQAIKFRLPLKGNQGQCRKCQTRFKLDADPQGHIYITQVQIPDNPDVINSLDECFEVLEIASNAIPLDIKSAYKKKIMAYHPDKVESLGPKIKAVAEQEVRRINAAYAMLQAHERV